MINESPVFRVSPDKVELYQMVGAARGLPLKPVASLATQPEGVQLLTPENPGAATPDMLYTLRADAERASKELGASSYDVGRLQDHPIEMTITRLWEPALKVAAVLSGAAFKLIDETGPKVRFTVGGFSSLHDNERFTRYYIQAKEVLEKRRKAANASRATATSDTTNAA